MNAEPVQNLVSHPDNVALLLLVVGVLVAVVVALRQALANDRLIKEGRREDILKRMRD